jgi:hypothetical protein
MADKHDPSEALGIVVALVAGCAVSVAAFY